ncbi:MAG: tRNA preQ1(34) S-adenosylmethionine ribosyltransferase-isomerase QueA [Planctomycetes bacterium]|nr:tRNA preQ1(34) S-adenosylmethionine ribosyltransferase-isomerase QueA [Planctomycetota bacterium]
MKTSLFNYDLPRELIAQQPLKQRDRSKLMVLHRKSGQREHRKFSQIIKYFQPGDTLVLNDTKVFPARLIGQRATGGLIELLLIAEKEPTTWEVFLNSRGKLQINETLSFGKKLSGRLIKRQVDRWLVKFNQTNILPLLNKIGKAPLPPYIKRPKKGDRLKTEDKKRYQTVYAQTTGAIAAPTAGLHFTRPLLDRIRKKGVRIVFITLHVGIGTFKPLKSDLLENHRMDSEYFEVRPEAIKSITEAKIAQKRVFAVGTTVCRVLETISGYTGLSLAHPDNAHSVRQNLGRGSLLRGWTDLFIRPPYQFKLVDALITNFHLPKGTPLVLASALAGRPKVLDAYQEAIKRKYRFYSYGDAMLVI